MKSLLLIAALILPSFAHATDWYTGKFSMHSTYVDLVGLTRTQGFVLAGQAVFTPDLYTGHIIFDGKSYGCRSMSYGVVAKGSVQNQYFCNLDANTLLDILEAHAIREQSFDNAIGVLTAYFASHAGADVVAVPVGYDLGKPQAISEYKRSFLEPKRNEQEVDLEFLTTGVEKF